MTLVTLNDFHGALYEQPLPDEPGRTVGGLPWIVGALEALRQDVPDLVLLDAGDAFQGSWPINATRGRGMVQAFNLMAVDAAVVGNHEFDYGGTEAETHPLRGALERAGQLAEYGYVASNIFERRPDGSLVRWQPPGFEPTRILERSGVRLGLIGLTTTVTPETTLRVNVADLVFADPVETVRELVPVLEAEGVDAIVVVGHLTGSCPERGQGIGAPCAIGGELGRLLTELPNGMVDVMVMGHEHQLISFRQGDTFVLESASNGRFLNRLDLVVGPDGVDADASTLHPPWRLIHDAADPGCEPGEYQLAPQQVDGRTVTPSAEALALVRSLEAEAGSQCDVVGCGAEILTRDYDAESPLGNFVADASRLPFPDADIAIQNSGGLRTDLHAGPITRGDLYDVMPFDNRLLELELSGSDLWTLFRIGTSGAHGVPQVSGASYGYDPARTQASDLNDDGQVETFETDRLCFLEVGGVPVSPAQTYRIVVSDFLYEGGDHLGFVLQRGQVVADDGPLIRDVLLDYMASQTACLGEAAPMSDPTAPRIRVGACP